LYLIAYGIYRFATEYLRPEPADYLGFTFYQWVALLLILGMSVHWLIDAKLKRREAQLGAA
jgi:prolipoprotein diacylglyceryltransferase